MILVSGYACKTGLGYVCRRLVDNLPAQRWLVVEHDRHGWGTLHHETTTHVVTANKHQGASDTWLPAGIFADSGVHAVVAAERVSPRGLFAEAKRRGIRTVLLVMAEWFHLGHPWVPHTDVFVAHTMQGYEHLCNLGLKGRTVMIPMPLDLREFPYRERVRADRFVFCNGWGGVQHRKGLGAVIEALDLDYTAISVQTQQPLAGVLPSGSVCRTETGSPAELYAEVDVAVQPSRWEGVGLQILEAMACGCPVLTSDAPPMSDYIRQAHGCDAGKLLAPASMGWQQLGGTTPWPDARVSGVDLLAKINELRGHDLRQMSREARLYIELIHGEQSWRRLREVIDG